MAKRAFLAFLLLASTATVAALWLSMRKPKDVVLFELLFPSSSIPGSYRPVAYGSRRSIFGDGDYVLAFNVSSNDLRLLMEQQGFKAVDPNSDPNEWGVDFCNEEIAQVAGSNLKVTPSFACYSRRSAKTGERLFYETNSDLGIIIGRGRYDAGHNRDTGIQSNRAN